MVYLACRALHLAVGVFHRCASMFQVRFAAPCPGISVIYSISLIASLFPLFEHFTQPSMALPLGPFVSPQIPIFFPYLSHFHFRAKEPIAQFDQFNVRFCRTYALLPEF